MKKQIRILSVFILTAIYCAAIGSVNASLNYSNFSEDTSISKEKVFTAISVDIFSEAIQPESSVNNYNNLPTQGFKNSFNEFWGILKTTENLFLTRFSQYTNTSINFLILHRKKDLIFPFHYFW